MLHVNKLAIGTYISQFKKKVHIMSVVIVGVLNYVNFNHDSMIGTLDVTLLNMKY